MFNLNELARAMINRLANDEIILNVSINVIVPLAGEKDIDFLTKEQKENGIEHQRNATGAGILAQPFRHGQNQH